MRTKSPVFLSNTDLLNKFGILLFLVSVVVAILTYQPLILVVPVLYLLFLLSTWDIRSVFLLLIAFLPISIEYNFSPTLGTDLPTEPLLVGLFIFFLLYLVSNKEDVFKDKYLWNHPLTLIVIFSFLAAAISTVFSGKPILSIKFLIAKSWYLGVYFLFSFFLFNSMSWVYKVLNLLVVITMFSILYVWFNHAQYNFVFDAINRSVVPIYRNHVNYGVFISAVLPFLLLLRFRTKKGSVERLFTDITVIIFLAAIYLSYTRGAWLALVLCLPIVISIKYNKVKSLLSIAVVTVFLGLGYLSYQNKYLDYAPEYRETIYHEDFADHMSATFELTDMSTVERFYRWIAGVRMIKDYFVTGVGPGNFVNQYKPYTVNEFSTYISENDEQSTVHNYFLFLFIEQGFAAFLLFMALLFYIFHIIQKCVKIACREDRRLLMALACSFTVIFVNNFFSDLIEADKIGPLFFIGIAVLLRIENKLSTESYNKEC